MAGVQPTQTASFEGIGDSNPTRYPVIIHHVPGSSGNIPVRRTVRDYRSSPSPGKPPSILLRQLLNPPLNCEEKIQFFMRQHERTMKDSESLINFSSGGYSGILAGPSRPGSLSSSGSDWLRRFNNLALNGMGHVRDGQEVLESRGQMQTLKFRHEGFARCLPSPSASADGEGYQLQIVTRVGNQSPPSMMECRKKLNARIRAGGQLRGPNAITCQYSGPHQITPRTYPGVKRPSQSSMQAAMQFERILGTGTVENLVQNKVAITGGFGGIGHTPVMGGVAQFWNVPCEAETHYANTQGIPGEHIFQFPAHNSFLLEREKWNHARFSCELCGMSVATPLDIHSHRWEHPYERLKYTEVTMNPTDFPVVRRQECPYIPCVENRISESRRRNLI